MAACISPSRSAPSRPSVPPDGNLFDIFEELGSAALT
jgi:hypothetical protein